MKLVTYRHNGEISIGKVDGDLVIDLPRNDPALPDTMLAFLQAGPDAMTRARAVRDGHAVPLSQVELLAPLPNPSKFLAIGMNYRKHVEEAAKVGVQTPPTQVWFNKQVSCINGPFGDVHLACRFRQARLRSRTVRGDRSTLPSCEPRGGSIGDRRLHGVQRRVGARLATGHADHDDRQVVRHLWSDRTVDRHTR